MFDCLRGQIEFLKLRELNIIITVEGEVHLVQLGQGLCSVEERLGCRQSYHYHHERRQDRPDTYDLVQALEEWGRLEAWAVAIVAS